MEEVYCITPVANNKLTLLAMLGAVQKLSLNQLANTCAASPGKEQS